MLCLIPYWACSISALSPPVCCFAVWTGHQQQCFHAYQTSCMMVSTSFWAPHVHFVCVCICECVLQVKEAAFLGHGLDQCWLIYHLLMMYIWKWLRAKKNLQKLNTHGGHRYILRQQYFCLLRSPVVANYVHKSQYIDMNNSLSWSYLLKWSPIHAIFTAHTISFPSYFLPQPLSLSLSLSL